MRKANRYMKGLSTYSYLALPIQNPAPGDPGKSVKSFLHFAAQQRRLFTKQAT